MKIFRVFFSENFQFLEVKFSVYLNRRVFVIGPAVIFGKVDIFFPHTYHNWRNQI